MGICPTGTHGTKGPHIKLPREGACGSEGIRFSAVNCAGSTPKEEASLKTSSQEGGEGPFALQLKHGEAISPDI